MCIRDSYYNKPTQEGQYQHFKAIADAVDKPLVLYNVPGRTAANIEPATLLRLAKIPNLSLIHIYGHTECVSLSLAKKASESDILAAWRGFTGVPQQLALPSAPPQVLIYDERPERPQPRFDVDAGGGMTTTIGRLRPCGLLDWKFVVLSHNTIRGAAGAAILNAELLKAKGYIA